MSPKISEHEHKNNRTRAQKESKNNRTREQKQQNMRAKITEHKPKNNRTREQTQQYARQCKMTKIAVHNRLKRPAKNVLEQHPKIQMFDGDTYTNNVI